MDAIKAKEIKWMCSERFYSEHPKPPIGCNGCEYADEFDQCTISTLVRRHCSYALPFNREWDWRNVEITTPPKEGKPAGIFIPTADIRVVDCPDCGGSKYVKSHPLGAANAASITKTGAFVPLTPCPSCYKGKVIIAKPTEGMKVEEIMAELPENPYPIDIFTMTEDEYVKAIPDELMRTRISGFCGRMFWDIAMRDVRRTLERIAQDTSSLPSQPTFTPDEVVEMFWRYLRENECSPDCMAHPNCNDCSVMNRLDEFRTILTASGEGR